MCNKKGTKLLTDTNNAEEQTVHETHIMKHKKKTYSFDYS